MLVPVVRLAIETGMRLAELLALEWRDIDVTKRTASLRESRVVPLSGSALGVLTGLPRHISNEKCSGHGHDGTASRMRGVAP